MLDTVETDRVDEGRPREKKENEKDCDPLAIDGRDIEPERDMTNDTEF
jgi:hypothetical protein